MEERPTVKKCSAPVKNAQAQQRAAVGTHGLLGRGPKQWWGGGSEKSEELEVLKGPGKGQTDKREEGRGTHIEVRLHVHPGSLLPSYEEQHEGTKEGREGTFKLSYC